MSSKKKKVVRAPHKKRRAKKPSTAPMQAYKEALARYGEMGADVPEEEVEAALELCDKLWRKLTPAQQDEFDGPQYARVHHDGKITDMFAALTAACARGAVGDWDGCQVQLAAAAERAPDGLPETAVSQLVQVAEEMRLAVWDNGRGGAGVYKG